MRSEPFRVRLAIRREFHRLLKEAYRREYPHAPERWIARQCRNQMAVLFRTTNRFVVNRTGRPD